MEINIEKNKMKFIRWCKGYITSTENAPRLQTFLDWLEGTDFYTTPASTKFHSNCDGGLCQHTLNVIARMFKIIELDKKTDTPLTAEEKEEIFLAAALHDLCKVNFYKKTERNKKNEQTGQWEKYPYWEVDDDFPMGHGEKSLYLAQKFFSINDKVAMAIRWHMGFSDVSFKGGSYDIGNAFCKYPFALYLNMADNLASFLDEEVTKY